MADNNSQAIADHQSYPWTFLRIELWVTHGSRLRLKVICFGFGGFEWSDLDIGTLGCWRLGLGVKSSEWRGQL